MAYYRKKYNRRNYNDDDNYGLAFVILLIGFMVISFLRENYDKILLGIAIIGLIILFIKLLVNAKEINQKFINKRDNRRIKKLMNKSLLYRKIVELNEKYEIESLDVFYDRYQVAYKSNLQTANIDDYLLMTIDKRYEDLKEYKIKYDELIKQYNDYKEEYDELKRYIDFDEADYLKFNISDYQKYQTKILEENKKSVNIDFKVVIYLNYRSKKGKVHDSKYKTYDKDQFIKIFKEYTSLKEQNKLYEISSRVERSKMSESLRYNVLKRDNYKCQICGATAKEGAKLQVDHIIPVSKGGKTELNNLQTLCSRCNIGKSNKV